ncbi:MAG: hypothetical protein LBP26_06350 [Clostridiales bacterium]|jgi:hypothetical protein|nr:hypothetical protein [Clostridiales bacterium]
MKKFLVLVLCLVVAFPAAACKKDTSAPPPQTLPPFEECEVGYMLDVYPKVEFDYKIADDFVVHISSISAELTAKNEIKEGDVLDENFYPFEVTIKANGTTDPKHAGKRIAVFVAVYQYGIINNGGSFSFTTTLYTIKENQKIYFTYCQEVTDT